MDFTKTVSTLALNILEIMNYSNQNLKFLRKLRDWTQQEFADKLGIKRSLLGAYDEGRAEPRFDVLENVSDMFKLTLDELMRKDLSQARGMNYLAKRRQLKIMSTDRAEIPFVPAKAAAGYLAGYADNEFIDELNTFTLPMVTGGNYRAFEIIGDSMMPTPSGSIIVGEKVDNFDDAKSNLAFIIVTAHEGIVYKRLVKSNRAKGKITLVSDNPAYQPYQVNAEEVLELWQASAIINKVTQQQRWDVNALANLVNNLQDQVTTMKKKMN